MAGAAAAATGGCRFVALQAPRRLCLDAHEQHWFDPANQHFLLLKDRMYRVLPAILPPGAVVPSEPASPSQPLYYDATGQDCLLARFSLDMTLLVIQRNRHTVEVVDVQHSREWVIDTRGGGSVSVGDRGQKAAASPAEATDPDLASPQEGDEDRCSILSGGIIWSDHGGNSQDLVILTERGMDIYKVSIKRAQCKLSRAFPHPGTRHFWYNAEQRFLLLSTGQGGWDLKGYFLRFEVSAALPKFELPPPEKLPRFELPAAAAASSTSSGGGGGKPLNPLDLHVVRLYGQIHAVYVESAEASLLVYRLGKDKVLPVCKLLFYVPGPVRVNTADNLLLLHTMDSKVTMIYDIHHHHHAPSAAVDSNGPSSLPAAFLRPLDPFCGGSPVAYHTHAHNRSHSQGHRREGSDPLNLSASSALSASAGAVALPAMVPVEEFYNPRAFQLLCPGWALDLEHHVLWSLKANLEAIAASHTTIPRIFPFLLRRGKSFAPRLPGFPRPADENIGAHAHAVVLGQFKTRLLEEVPLFPPPLAGEEDEEGDEERRHTISTMMRICLQSSVAAVSPGSEAAGQQSSSSSSSVPSAEQAEEEELRRRRAKRLSPEGDVVVTQEDLLKEVFDPLASIALLQDKDLPSPPYLAAVLLQCIGLLQSLIAEAAAAEEQAAAAASFLSRRRRKPKAPVVVDPRLVILALRLLFSQGRLDQVVQFLRYQQAALDSEALALFLLDEGSAPLLAAARTRAEAKAGEEEGGEEEEEEDDEEEQAGLEEEFHQLLRDMLARLHRLDLLVLQLLRENRLAEAVRTMRHMVRRKRREAPPGSTVDTSISESPLLLHAFSDAAVSRVRSLAPPEEHVSHRAAVYYLLHEWLRNLEPTLFAGGPEDKKKPAEPKPEGASPSEKPRFAELLPGLPFEGLFTPSVAATLAQHIFGYERKPAPPMAAGGQPPEKENGQEEAS